MNEKDKKYQSREFVSLCVFVLLFEAMRREVRAVTVGKPDSGKEVYIRVLFDVITHYLKGSFVYLTDSQAGDLAIRLARDAGKIGAEEAQKLYDDILAMEPKKEEVQA